ncbi:ABC transporter permease [Nocardioides sp. zg-DK7169]|nr:ABC transporter permease [Nocardioides sp. zg-DK7169]
MSAGLGAILVLLLAVFILPSLKSGAHDLPIGIVGEASATAALEEAVTATAPDAYDVERLASRDALADAVRDREVVGGFVVTDDGLEALVASAGSPAISATLGATATAVGETAGTEVTLTDIVPLPEADPTGIGIGGLAFPLVFGGIVPVVAFGAIFPRSTRWRLAGLAGFALLGGLLVAAVLRFWFGSIETGFWPVAGSMALGIGALAFPLAGLKQLLGGKGFTIGAMTMMFLGNPLAGIATTGAWLPSGLGAFGQVLPPGAAGALVRSSAYFGGAGGLVPGLTLLAWILVGLALYTVGTRPAAARSAAADA